MKVLVLVTSDQNWWKTESDKHVGLTPLWGSVSMWLIGGVNCELCLGEQAEENAEFNVQIFASTEAVVWVNCEGRLASS